MKNQKINLNKYLENILIKSFRKSSILGTYQFYILISLVFLSLGYERIFLFLIFDISILYIITIPLRLIFFRERPEKRNYDNIIDKIDASSFPSQHSARAVILFLTLNNFFHYMTAFAILTGIVTISIISARVYLRQHYVSDVVAGTIFGILIFFLVGIIIW